MSISKPLLETTVAERSPDVALLNGHAAGSRQLVGRLTSLHPQLRIVALANEPSRSYALRLLTYGVSACISSDASASDILAAIHLSVEGKQLIACSSTARVTPHLSELAALTRREQEVLTHLRHRWLPFLPSPCGAASPATRNALPVSKRGAASVSNAVESIWIGS